MLRLLDIIISGTALFFLMPVFAFVSLFLLATGEGEVFFGQERLGKDAQPFKLLKFATMLKNSPFIQTGTVTTKNDPRVLPFGRILRASKINELPQLINILLGSMSIVGPRPQTIRCFNAFPEEFRQTILSVRPGLSGIGSIVFRNEEDIIDGATEPLHYYDNVIAPYKAELESWYVKHNSLTNYFLIIIVTAWVVVDKKSNIVWKVFPKLPEPPLELRSKLNYPS